MSVPKSAIIPGAVFQFPDGSRRVTWIQEIHGWGSRIHWEYADGQPRRGRIKGYMWIGRFANEASEVREVA